MSSHCGVVIMFDMKQVSLEHVYDSLPGLTYVINDTRIIFQAVN